MPRSVAIEDRWNAREDRWQDCEVWRLQREADERIEDAEMDVPARVAANHGWRLRSLAL